MRRSITPEEYEVIKRAALNIKDLDKEQLTIEQNIARLLKMDTKHVKYDFLFDGLFNGNNLEEDIDEMLDNLGIRIK